ncbi:unnamed protein product [Peniophora sp. CBMAI 1063]|nr:unnamed protein product [Peniophora sp. CBMAI 1063]
MSHSVTVEEVPDEGDDFMDQIKITMPDAKKIVRDVHPSNAGRPQRQTTTAFDAKRTVQNLTDHAPWHPFASYDEYKFTRWLLRSGLSHRKVDEFLKGDVFHSARALHPDRYHSFHDNKSFLLFLDQLQTPGLVDWKHRQINIEGDVPDPRRPGKSLTETVDLWGRDALEATEIQCDDGTVVPIILASDKTQLSTFSGDKQAWPVYLSIGNISGAIRSQPLKGATVLLGYLPVTKLQCFCSQEAVKRMGHRLFHHAMSLLLEPLVEVGRTGVEMPCADGWSRKVFPILAAYLADFPEQCLITCIKSNCCPVCKVDRLERGHLLNSLYRAPDDTLEHLRRADDNDLQDVPKPFWADLPYANIFSCITPDILHQLHKGVFRDHLVNWVTRDYAEEINDRFARIPPYPGLRIFARGISTISQWTGNEYRQMEKVFLALRSGLNADDPRFIIAARAVLDFVYLAHFPVHSTSTLAMMQEALQRFHSNKQVFIDLGARTHFNIPKIHSMLHYVPFIIDFGSVLPLCTDGPERLHIDLAKLGYRASNRRNYVIQMILWLHRREKLAWFESYLVYIESAFGLPSDDDPMDGSSLEEDEAYNDELCEDGDELETEELELVDVFDRDLPQVGVMRDMNAVHPTDPAPTAASSDNVSWLSAGDDEVVTDSSSRFLPYRISKRPAYGRVSVSDLHKHFHALHFTRELQAFLLRETPSFGQVWLSSLDNLRFGLYAQFRRTLPSLRGLPEGDVMEDVVYAMPTSSGLSLRFSTVLYIHNQDEAAEYGVQGYRVERIRAIFDVPDIINRQRPPNASRHLAYLELFTPFEEGPERHSRLWRVARQMSNGEPRPLVVPLDLIFQSCHLIPNFGTAVNLSWTSQDVLDQAMRFYLNPFIDHHMYLFV